MQGGVKRTSSPVCFCETDGTTSQEDADISALCRSLYYLPPLNHDGITQYNRKVYGDRLTRGAVDYHRKNWRMRRKRWWSCYQQMMQIKIKEGKRRAKERESSFPGTSKKASKAGAERRRQPFSWASDSRTLSKRPEEPIWQCKQRRRLQRWTGEPRATVQGWWSNAIQRDRNLGTDKIRKKAALRASAKG